MNLAGRAAIRPASPSVDFGTTSVLPKGSAIGGALAMAFGTEFYLAGIAAIVGAGLLAILFKN